MPQFWIDNNHWTSYIKNVLVITNMHFNISHCATASNGEDWYRYTSFTYFASKLFFSLPKKIWLSSHSCGPPLTSLCPLVKSVSKRPSHIHIQCHVRAKGSLMKEPSLATVHTACVSLTAISFVPWSSPRSPVIAEQPDHFRFPGWAGSRCNCVDISMFPQGAYQMLFTYTTTLISETCSHMLQCGQTVNVPEWCCTPHWSAFLPLQE